MIRRSPHKDAIVEFENADTVAKVVNWYHDHCSWIHPKLVLDKFIPHFISQGKKIVNTGEAWKTRGEYEQFAFFQKKMEEHLGKTDLKAVAVNEYNMKQKQKGDDDLSEIIHKMSLEPPSEAMEKKAQEIEYEISKIQTDVFDQKIQDVVQEGFDLGQQIIKDKQEYELIGKEFSEILENGKKQLNEELKGDDIVNQTVSVLYN